MNSNLRNQLIAKKSKVQVFFYEKTGIKEYYYKEDPYILNSNVFPQDSNLIPQGISNSDGVNEQSIINTKFANKPSFRKNFWKTKNNQIPSLLFNTKKSITTPDNWENIKIEESN